MLLTERRELIRIEIPSLRVTSTSLRDVAASDSPWGLGCTGPGEVWTLLNRTTVAQLSTNGKVIRRLALGRPHVGLFSVGRRLVYQTLPRPNEPLINVGPPGEATRTAIADLAPRSLDAGRPEMLVANLVMCGATRDGALPCWFPDEAVLHLIGADSGSQTLRLRQLVALEEQRANNIENRPQPVWDAYVRGNSLWILGSGGGPADESATGAGWHILQYGVSGQLRTARPLSEAARLILAAQETDVWLLLKSGVIEHLMIR